MIITTLTQGRTWRAAIGCAFRSPAVMLTIPSQLGVEFSLRIVESFATHVAPALGWVSTRP